MRKTYITININIHLAAILVFTRVAGSTHPKPLKALGAGALQACSLVCIEVQNPPSMNNGISLLFNGICIYKYIYIIIHIDPGSIYKYIYIYIGMVL